LANPISGSKFYSVGMYVLAHGLPTHDSSHDYQVIGHMSDIAVALSKARHGLRELAVLERSQPV
jgi:hypothetical protein